MMKTIFFGFLLWILITDNVHGYGYTYPDVTIRKRVGETVEIICVIDSTELKGINSSDLFFKANNYTIPKDSVQILNETAIRLRIENAQKMDEKFTCKFDNTGIGYNSVLVGYEPQPVGKIKCISPNWQNVTCSFQRPENPVPPTYDFYYIFETSLDSPIQNLNHCKLNGDYNRTFYCTIDFTSSAGIYRQTYKYIFIRLMARNVLGNKTENFIINHFQIVRPDPPRYLKVLNVTSDSARLNWTIPDELIEFKENLVYMINYTTEVNKEKWVQKGPVKCDTSKINGKKHVSIVLQDLEYAHTWYDVRVSSKVESADDIPELWSNFSYYNFLTASRIPDDPPLTDIGGFNINDYGYVFLFWKELPKEKHNGKDMRYNVTEINHLSTKPNGVTHTMAKFEMFHAINLDKDLEFSIHSQNSEGKSKLASHVRVPKASERCKDPTHIKKIKTNNQLYNLTWRAPTEGPEITSYTVFWCESKNELANQCEGSIDFQRVDRNVFNYTLASNNTLNFAVSANSRNSTSGMKWVLCTALEGNAISKLTSIYATKIQPTYIELNWSIACIDRTLIIGYTLHYCPIKDIKTLECKDAPQMVNITGEAIGYNLTNLKPYTTYKIEIQMFSPDLVGPLSDPLVKPTLEAAPSPPRNLTYHDVTNTSVALIWEVPENVNGVVNKYIVSFNGKEIKEEVNIGQQAGPTIRFILNNLEGFTDYEVLVIACTVECSKPSNKVHFKTAVGVPGEIKQPRLINNSPDGPKFIYWDPPPKRSGLVQYYELKTRRTLGQNVDERIIQIKRTNCTLEILSCGNSANNFEFSVRAVNVIHSAHAEESIIQDYHQSLNFNKYHVKRDLAENYISLEQIHSDDSDDNRSNLLKRHSNAEITTNSKYINSNRNYDDKIENKNSENKRLFEVTDHRAKDPSFHTICEEQNDEQLQQFIKADKYSTQLYGNWSSATVFYCNPGPTSGGVYFMLVFLIIFTMAFVYGTFFVTKKFKKMKDIGVELPAGLEDIKEEAKGKNIEGGINAHDDPNHDVDVISTSEQEQSLLRSRMESASSNSTENNSQCDYNVDNSEYDQQTEDDSAQSVSENMEIDKFSPTPLLPVQIVSPPVQKNDVEIHIINNEPTNSNYVQAPSVMKPSQRLTSNGYVTHDSIIAKPATSGYTPWSAINSVTQPESVVKSPTIDEHKTKRPIVASTGIQGISGYVTHKQLSDFGHLMH